MIFIEDERIKLNGVVLPGLIKSIEVTESAKVDEQEVEARPNTSGTPSCLRYSESRVRMSRSPFPSSARTQQPTALRRSSSRSSPIRGRTRSRSLRQAWSCGNTFPRPLQQPAARVVPGARPPAAKPRLRQRQRATLTRTISNTWEPSGASRPPVTWSPARRPPP